MARYPVKFVNEVKATYPNSPDLHRALDRGGEIVGRYLDDYSGGNIGPDEIVKMIDSGCVHDLRKRAERLNIRKKLWGEWCTIAEKMFYARSRA